MTRVSQTVELGASADAVWEVIGDFNGLPQWHPAIDASRTEEVEGRQRRILSVTGGGTLVEQLEAWDDEGRAYEYTMVEGPMPVADYRATLTVTSVDEDKCQVVWSGEFDAAGATQDEASQVVESVYVTGLHALKRQFGAQN